MPPFVSVSETDSYFRFLLILRMMAFRREKKIKFIRSYITWSTAHLHKALVWGFPYIVQIYINISVRKPYLPSLWICYFFLFLQYAKIYSLCSLFFCPIYNLFFLLTSFSSVTVVFPPFYFVFLPFSSAVSSFFSSPFSGRGIFKYIYPWMIWS